MPLVWRQAAHERCGLCTNSAINSITAGALGQLLLMQPRCLVTSASLGWLEVRGVREEILESSCHLHGKREYLRCFLCIMDVLLSLMLYFLMEKNEVH